MMQLVDLILTNASVQAIVVMGLVYVLIQGWKLARKALADPDEFELRPTDEEDLKKRMGTIVTAVLLCALTELARASTQGVPYDVWSVVTQIIAVIAGSTGIHTLGKALRAGGNGA